MMGNDTNRRFSSLARLYGEKATEQLAKTHILIAGIGGVGSWVAEALARSGVGKLTLVDLDHVAESNINRQVHALTKTLGQSKVQAMADRIAQINPNAELTLVENFMEEHNSKPYLSEYCPDVVLDCTDQVKAKIAMVLAARDLNIPLLMSGGAGGKTDVLSLRYSDLSMVKHDHLLGRVRQLLRQEHGFPKGSDAKGRALKKPPKMQVSCLWYEQTASLPSAWLEDKAPQGLSCAGYGSSVTVTATMGLAIAQKALELALQKTS